jgi:mRNA interferase MazF
MKDNPGLSRGDVVVCAMAGDFGKPRPAVVVQSDLFNETHASVVLCPITSELTGLDLFRLHVPRSTQTGLRVNSEIMVDKLTAVKRTRISGKIGKLSAGQIDTLNDALRLWLDLPS